MALNKKIKTPSGAAACHWRIVGVVVSEADRVLVVAIAGYLNASACAAGREPLGVVHQRMTPEHWADSFGPGSIDYPPKAALYAWLHTLPEWQGAKPC